MKKNIFALIVFASLINNTNAQFSIHWQKCFGGSNWDIAYSIQQTIDSGYIVAGPSTSNDSNVSGNHGLQDFWILKFTSIGSLQWQKCFGGSNGDIAHAIQQTLDKGYIIIGETQSNDGDVSGDLGGSDYWVIKIDSIGNNQWQKCYGGTNEDKGYSIIQINHGEYVLTGYSKSNDGDVTGNHGNYDFWVAKIDGSGNIIWQKSYGGSNDEIFPIIKQTRDGGYIITGSSASNDGDVSGNHGAGDGWVIKLDSMGNKQWQKCIGGTNVEYANDIQQTFDDGYVVACFTQSNDGDVSGLHGANDFWVVKLDSIGNIQWQKCLGGTDGDIATSILCTIDNGYVVTGRTYSVNGDVVGNHGHSDYWIVKLDTSGNIQNKICLGGTQDDLPYSIIKSNDGGFVVAGYTASNDGDVTGNHGTYDSWIVKLDLKTSIEESYNKKEFKIYPNPFHNSFDIEFEYKMIKNATLQLYNISGILIYTKNLDEKINVIDISQFSSGMYFISIYAEKLFYVNKIIKL